MGAKSKHDAQSYRPGTTIIAGTFQTDPDTYQPINVRGEGYDVERVGSGIYLVTLRETFINSEGLTANVAPTNPGEYVAQAGKYEPSNSTFPIFLCDYSSGPNDHNDLATVSFTAVMRSSSLGGN